MLNLQPGKARFSYWTNRQGRNYRGGKGKGNLCSPSPAKIPSVDGQIVSSVGYSCVGFKREKKVDDLFFFKKLLSFTVLTNC